MANFPNSVYSPSAKAEGNTITAAFFNDPEAEITAIEAGFRNGTAPLNSSNSTVANLSITGGCTVASLSFTNLSVAGNSTVAALQAGNSTLTNLTVSGGSTVGTLQGGASTLVTLALSGAAPGTPVANTLYSNNLCKARGLISFGGAGSTASILSGVNVSSVTAASSGLVDIAFATAIGSSDYVVVNQIVGTLNKGAINVVTQASTGFRVSIYDANGGGALSTGFRFAVLG